MSDAKICIVAFKKTHIWGKNWQKKRTFLVLLN